MARAAISFFGRKGRYRFIQGEQPGAYDYNSDSGAAAGILLLMRLAPVHTQLRHTLIQPCSSICLACCSRCSVTKTGTVLPNISLKPFLSLISLRQIRGYRPDIISGWGNRVAAALFASCRLRISSFDNFTPEEIRCVSYNDSLRYNASSSSILLSRYSFRTPPLYVQSAICARIWRMTGVILFLVNHTSPQPKRRNRSSPLSSSVIWPKCSCRC